MYRYLVASAALAMALALPAYGQANNTAVASAVAPVADSGQPPVQFAERTPRYKLEAGDTFDLDFPLSPEFNETAAIQPDGFISLKGAASIHVQGETVPELTNSVKAAYAGILHEPIVSVALKDFEKPSFIAAGQVGKPGKYDLRGDMTVTEAVAIAGGFTQSSKHSQVVLFRPMPNGTYQTNVLNVKKLLAQRNLNEDIHLRPGDILYVPQNSFSHYRPFLPTSGMGAFYNPAAF